MKIANGLISLIWEWLILCWGDQVIVLIIQASFFYEIVIPEIGISSVTFGCGICWRYELFL